MQFKRSFPCGACIVTPGTGAIAMQAGGAVPVDIEDNGFAVLTGAA